MRKYITKLFGFIVFSSLLVLGCSTTKLSLVYMDEAYNEGPVMDILIIGLTDEEGVRKSFENRFVKALTAMGSEAVSSFEILDIPEDKKLEKEDILRIIDEQGNDAVIITRLIGVDKEQVYEPITRHRGGYYGHYSYAFSYSYGGVYRTHTFVNLETSLYHAKTEKLIWSAKSETWNPESDAKLLDEVIKTVINDLKKNGIIQAK
jgi:hypothetical protein